MGMPVGVVMAVGVIALLVHGAVMVMVVMVVATVLGPAAVSLALLGWKVARLRSGAEVCTQAWQGDDLVYIWKYPIVGYFQTSKPNLSNYQL